MAEPLWINTAAGVPAYTAAELRQAMAFALPYDGMNLGGRAGIRPGGDQMLVSLSGETITIQPGLACMSPNLSTTQSTYWIALPAPETHTLAAADATNPRKDKVVLRVYDHDEDSSNMRIVQTEYLVGTPGPTPAVPATPPGSIWLATIDVPKVGGGSAAVTDNRRFAVASGGITPTNFNSEFPAGVEGRYRDRLDLNILERDSGTTWETVADPAAYRAWTSYTPVWASNSSPQPSLGNGTNTGRWIQIGKTVHVSGQLLLGSTSTLGTGYWTISLPVPAVVGTIGAGSAVLYDASTATSRAPANMFLASTSTVRFFGPGGDVSGSVPFAWTNTDQIRWSFTYEAA